MAKELVHSILGSGRKEKKSFRIGPSTSAGFESVLPAYAPLSQPTELLGDMEGDALALVITPFSALLQEPLY